MLLAPLSLPQTESRRRGRAGVVRRPALVPPRARRSGEDSLVPAFLFGWLALGLGVMIFVPGARGGTSLGATLPFWLAGAPALNLLWWKRRECLTALRRRWQTRHRRAVASSVSKVLSVR